VGFWKIIRLKKGVRNRLSVREATGGERHEKRKNGEGAIPRAGGSGRSKYHRAHFYNRKKERWGNQKEVEGKEGDGVSKGAGLEI